MLCHHCKVTRKNFFDDPRMSSMQSSERRDRDNFAADVAGTHQQQRRPLPGQHFLVLILESYV